MRSCLIWGYSSSHSFLQRLAAGVVLQHITLAREPEDEAR